MSTKTKKLSPWLFTAETPESAGSKQMLAINVSLCLVGTKVSVSTDAVLNLVGERIRLVKSDGTCVGEGVFQNLRWNRLT